MSHAEGTLFKVPTRDGVTTTLFWEPAPDAKATVFLFPGGAGGFGKVEAGKAMGLNFLVRSEPYFIASGFNVAIFGLQWLGGVNAVAGDWGMWPVGVAVGGEWWRLGTAAFLHGSVLHIAFNMYVLFALGPTLERILGHGRYVTDRVATDLGLVDGGRVKWSPLVVTA